MRKAEFLVSLPCVAGQGGGPAAGSIDVRGVMGTTGRDRLRVADPCPGALLGEQAAGWSLSVLSLLERSGRGVRSLAQAPPGSGASTSRRMGFTPHFGPRGRSGVFPSLSGSRTPLEV